MKKYQGPMRAPTGKKHFFTGEIADDFASAGRRKRGSSDSRPRDERGDGRSGRAGLYR